MNLIKTQSISIRSISIHDWNKSNNVIVLDELIQNEIQISVIILDSVISCEHGHQFKKYKRNINGDGDLPAW